MVNVVFEQPVNGTIIRTQTPITVYSQAFIQMTELEQRRMNEPAPGVTRQHKFEYKCSSLILGYSTDYTTVLSWLSVYIPLASYDTVSYLCRWSYFPQRPRGRAAEIVGRGVREVLAGVD